ncbi:ArsB/NhaD family transporter [Candidatus Parcubacteria bacterium]|nr:ArsB/NhaD family transporter [Candidatus Parcubacteria bacterium]
MSLAFLISIFIFVVTFILIFTEKIHRTVIASVGAVVMVSFGMLYNFYNSEQALAAIDFNTIGLLLGMMIIVAILEKTGFFQYLAIVAAKKTKGDPWKLVVVLGLVTTLVSLILDNVTTVVLIAPVTIIIVRLLKISPIPILIAEALLSNTGGVATLVGDPPNIMIGSAANFSFNDFLTHTAPIVFIAWIVTLLVLKFVFRKEMTQKPENIHELEKMDERKALKDVKTLKKVGIVLALVVVLFFVHSQIHMPPSMVALIGASLALILVAPTKDPQKILEKVEWSVLGFFAALFVIVGGLEHAGVLEQLAYAISNLARGDIVIAALAILWISAIMSAIIDNIPFTVAMIPVIGYLETQGIPVNLLWWALALGVGFGGNGTPIGSTANIVVVAKSEQTDTPITFRSWLKSGSITMVSTLIVASIAIFFFADYLGQETAGQKIYNQDVAKHEISIKH